MPSRPCAQGWSWWPLLAAEDPRAPQTRVGIATGLVVVGDLIGSGASQEQAIVGETPNLAARLQGIAEPNSVVIAESTRKLVGNLFELEDLGAKDLKGIGGPVRAWAALRPSSVEGRFEALHASGADCPGRAGRRTRIAAAALVKGKVGRRPSGVASGEAGIGKSRLTAALHGTPRRANRTLVYATSARRSTPIARFTRSLANGARRRICSRDTRQAKLDKLDAVLAQNFTSRQDATSLPRCCRFRTMDAIQCLN